MSSAATEAAPAPVASVAPETIAADPADALIILNVKLLGCLHTNLLQHKHLTRFQTGLAGDRNRPTMRLNVKRTDTVGTYITQKRARHVLRVAVSLHPRGTTHHTRRASASRVCTTKTGHVMKLIEMRRGSKPEWIRKGGSPTGDILDEALTLEQCGCTHSMSVREFWWEDSTANQGELSYDVHRRIASHLISPRPITAANFKEEFQRIKEYVGG